MYNRVFWQDHVTEFWNRFNETSNLDGSITLEAVEGEIIQEGTPQNAANFNNIEGGIISSNERNAELSRISRLQQRSIDNLRGVVGEITLVNTVRYPFNNSKITIALSMPRVNTNYTVHIVDVVSNYVYGNGVGRINICDKTINSFSIAFTGSARNVAVKYVVHGGML